jgi:hypothetical protein
MSDPQSEGYRGAWFGLAANHFFHMEVEAPCRRLYDPRGRPFGVVATDLTLKEIITFINASEMQLSANMRHTLLQATGGQPRPRWEYNGERSTASSTPSAFFGPAVWMADGSMISSTVPQSIVVQKDATGELIFLSVIVSAGPGRNPD